MPSRTCAHPNGGPSRSRAPPRCRRRRAPLPRRLALAGDADAARLRGAYAALGVDSDASNDEIKKAYRRLMNKNHPDKIAGSNPDAAVVAEAERRTREVRGAYEMLKARRSIR